MKANTFEDIASRFDSLTKINGECLDWTGGFEKRWGYGRIKIRGKSVKAHRLSYQIHVGSIPEGMLVCHKCDRPICVNPEHLFIGTNLDNQRDCIAKGRQAIRIGEQAATAKLTSAQVLEIRLLRDVAVKLVAARFGVKPRTIYAVWSRQNWSHLP